jgi:hypothetical protein
MTCGMRRAVVIDARVQLAGCFALGVGCDGAGGEWEASGVCGVSRGGWRALDNSTEGLRHRLMDF